jgi:ABC-type uncharacterized transport system ATPase subunit
MSLIQFKGVAKYFGSGQSIVRANEDLNFEVKRGTIHGIIGENGAGKSTAMKMLYGLYPPTRGEIHVHGQKIAFKSPQDAIRQGIGMVHQHFMLAESMSVLDNIILGAEPKTPWGTIDRKKAERDLTALSKKYGLDVPLHQPIEVVPVGVQQRVEILKTLYRGAEILILDEPTAVLTPAEVIHLFENLRRLKNEGKTILIITHKLKEVLALTDQVTVFRAGRVSGETKTSDATVQSLADMMVGRKVEMHLKIDEVKVGAPVLSVKNLFAHRPYVETLSGQVYEVISDHSAVESLKNVSLQVRAGEIVGIAGVEGNGQSDLIQAILHPSQKTYLESGTVEVLGKNVTQWKTKRILDLGVGVIPEDRHHQGLMLTRSVTDNFILGQQSNYSWYGWMKRRWVDAAVKRALESFDVRPRRPDLAVKGLSGGNQQKVIIAREFEKSPQLLIAAQPTRGVDVGAIEFIHNRILKARSDGVGVLLVSSELDEVMALSDRILVMYAGQVVAEMNRSEATEHKIGVYMGGSRES